MRKFIYIAFGLLLSCKTEAQFYNHQWLIGNQWLQTVPKGRMTFDSVSYQFQTEYRKMAFDGTQGNICDAQGNFLMSSNGVWIANANNDTMLNGSGLNPGYFVNAWPNGLLITNGNLFIPTPGDSLGYTLFHQTRLDPNSFLGGIYETLIDLTLDSAKGGVSIKNNTLIIDQLSWGIAACKHANGRDWWITIMQDNSDIVYKILYSTNGVYNTNTQALNFNVLPLGNVSQITFSTTGNLFAYTVYDNSSPVNSYVILCDFDRCSGQFSNTRTISVSNGEYLYGLSFSPSSDFLYTNSASYIFQIDITDQSIDTVAVYDGFSYPIPSAATTFFNEYLAANGKIYLTSGNGVQHLHEINYPDSAGIACDVQQHAVSLGVWHFRAVPNHPNYNLGPVVGSVCDTLSVGLTESIHDFHFSIAPNPVSDGWVKLTYLLPQNKAGVLEVYSITGQKMYGQTLPPWSTLQLVQLPDLEAGIYTAVISSGSDRNAKKLVVLK
jgi:hypothetical protein